MTMEEWTAQRDADVEKYLRAAKELKRGVDTEERRYLAALGRFHEAVNRRPPVPTGAIAGGS